jgi:translation initiation factor 1
MSKSNQGTPKPKVYLEKRAGKKVTIISGLHTYGEQRLSAIAKELKVMCGAGGTLKNGVIEIQGDFVLKTGEFFKSK